MECCPLHQGGALQSQGGAQEERCGIWAHGGRTCPRPPRVPGPRHWCCEGANPAPHFLCLLHVTRPPCRPPTPTPAAPPSRQSPQHSLEHCSRPCPRPCPQESVMSQPQSHSPCSVFPDSFCSVPCSWDCDWRGEGWGGRIAPTGLPGSRFRFYFRILVLLWSAILPIKMWH